MPDEVEKPRPRTQAERSAQTRKRIMRAAITSLYRNGYSATSTIVVANDAKVSRGAMLHQFPTKAEMMAGVLDAVYEEQSAYYLRVLGAIEDPVERLVQMTRAAWNAFKRPAGVAQMEIFLAARSDPDLKPIVRKANKRIDAESRRGVAYLARAAGIGDAKTIDAIWALGVSAVRGLQTQWINDLNGAPADEALGMIETTLRELVRARAKKI